MTKFKERNTTKMFVSIPSSHFWTLWLLAALAISCTGQVVFDLPDNAKPLRLIAVDNNTGDVFLGANGYTFKLDQNLTEVASVVTKHESNKVLLISGDKLVDCRTKATQSICFLRELNDITSFTNSSPFCWPSNSPDDDTVSYITAYSTTGVINERDVVYSAYNMPKNCDDRHNPWISVRELDGTTMYSDFQLREYVYKGIFFKGGFTFKDHSYFVTNQERYQPGSTELVASGSRVIQLCKFTNSPPIMASFPYTDMPLVCKDEQTEYKWIQAMTVLKASSDLASDLDINQEDEVLVTAFSSGNGTQYVQSPSAVCLFAMKEIQARLNAARSSCQWSGAQGYLYGSTICEPAASGLIFDFCDVYHAFIGHLTLTASPVFVTSSLITSLASVVTATATVVLAGTDQGHVQKISLSYPSGSFEYADDVIDEGHPVKPGLFLSPWRDYAYVMTENKVVRLPLYKGCMQNNDNINCVTCIATGDILCGWCVLEGRCSSEDECRGSQQANHWLRATDDVCVTMSLSRISIRVGETDLLDVTINIMPAKSDTITYVCAFDNSDIATTTRNGNEFQCQIPLLHPSFIPKSDMYTVVAFSMKSNDTEFSFVHRDFFYYDCGRFTSCFECTDPRFDCTWCVEGNRCTHAACAAGDTALSNTQKDLCPQIHETDTTLIPNNVFKEITVIGSNLPISGTYKCHLSNQQEVTARWINDKTLLCEAHKYTYTDSVKEVITALTVSWGAGFQIDNKNAIKVTLYKCELMGSDCSSCQASLLSKPYECSSCTDHTKCTYRGTSQCGTDISCPAPTISRIQPVSGPTAGGTTITIDGEELGRNVADIDIVTVMGRECKNIAWISSTRITCTTSAGTGAGTVFVNVRNKSAIPYSSFEYKKPDPQLPDPSQGQQSGGTIITFRGDNLDIGSDLIILLDGITCTELQAGIVITCRVPPLDLAHRNDEAGVSVNITLMIDDYSEVFNFMYQPDPIVTSIQPDISFKRSVAAPTGVWFRLWTPKNHWLHSTDTNTSGLEPRLRHDIFVQVKSHSCPRLVGEGGFPPRPDFPPGIIWSCPAFNLMMAGNVQNIKHRSFPFDSGGRELAVLGQRLHIIQEMTIIVGQVQQLCEKSADGSYFTCLSSPFRGDSHVAAITLKMDGVTYALSQLITYVEDPTFFNLTADGSHLSGDGLQLLTIHGSYFSRAATSRDVTISIGGVNCRMVSVNIDTIECVPGQGNVNNAIAAVEVRIGYIFRIVGYIDYSPPSTPTSDNTVIIFSAVAVVIVFVSVSILISILYFVRVRKLKKQRQKLQNTIQEMDVNTQYDSRNEYTDCHIYDTIEFEGRSNQDVPYNTYQVYLLKMLFPVELHNDHCFLTRPYDPDEANETVLSEMNNLEQLLLDKFFLLSVIRSLDREQDMTHQDRANITSMVTIALLGKMDYCVDILRSLRPELINNAPGQQNSLKRSETIAEMYLENWLVLCMYSYIVDHIGPSLFNIYEAVVLMMNSGPICAVTGNAKYTLSENKVLKYPMNISSLSLNVEWNSDTFSCTALSCDTISQVKQKCLGDIYKTKAVSDTPNCSKFDLGWHRQDGSHVILRDVDDSSDRHNSHTKMNTLHHYKVPDGSTLTLILCSNNDLDKNPAYEPTPFLNLTNSDEEEGSTLWHLIKPDTVNTRMETNIDHEDIYLHIIDDSTISQDNVDASMETEIDDNDAYLHPIDESTLALKEYLDNFFAIAFDAGNLPVAIKYLIQHLDREKGLSYTTRLLSQLIRKPENMFDIHRPKTINQCLDPLAQMFDDCLSVRGEIPESLNQMSVMEQIVSTYRPRAAAMFQTLQEGDQVSERDFMASIKALSKNTNTDIRKVRAIYELYGYLNYYCEKISPGLSEKMDVADKFNSIMSAVNTETQYESLH